MRLNNTTKLVKTILENFPKTRDDDYLLWLEVLKHIKSCAVADYLNASAYDFLKCAKYMPFPHYETVSRVRRKLQKEFPELRATKETRSERAELEKRYRNYARRML